MDVESMNINTLNKNNGSAEQINLPKGGGKGSASTKKPAPQRKIYKERNSMLTDLYENKHISTVYSIFIAITLYLILINVLYEWQEHQVLSFGFMTLAQKFYKIEIALLGWLLIMSLTFLTFPVFKMWSNIYHRTQFKKLTGTLFILLYCVYSIGIHVITVWICLQFNLAPITSFALLLETLRIGMKNYAFVRWSAGQVTTCYEYKSPTFRHFVYFMFCPTMLYRDSYPRTSRKLSWKRIFKYLLEFLVCVYSISLVNNNFLQKSFINYGKTEVTLFRLIIRWIEITIIVTPLFYFYFFYSLQHAWLNMFAELLRFGDRAFYKDWWTSKTMNEYYRRWSLPVHEWLYEYMYIDLYYHGSRKSFTIASLVTFVISAIVHEYVLVVSLGFFVPVLLLLYLSVGLLYLFVDLGERVGNVFVWFNLIIGMALLHLLYFMEYYARINCPSVRPQNATLSYYYTPMFIKCNNILIQ